MLSVPLEMMTNDRQPDPEFHIRWRERLSQASWGVIHPREDDV
jgi:hypothetical protein